MLARQSMRTSLWMYDWTLSRVFLARSSLSENAVTATQVPAFCGAQVTCTITEESGAPPTVIYPVGAKKSFCRRRLKTDPVSTPEF